MDAFKFIEFVTFMGMKQTVKVEFTNGQMIILFESEEYDSELEQDKIFTARGYDAFGAGLLFDKNGTIIKSYIDSHVTFRSENNYYISKILSDSK